MTRAHVQALIDASAKHLSKNYNRYWPKKGLADPNERDLTLALGAVLLQEGYQVFCEVPDHSGVSRNQDGRLDLLGIAPSNTLALLVESKNIASAKQRHTVENDLSKMKRFRPVRREKAPAFPSRCLRMVLLMGWTGDGMEENPFLNPMYQKWFMALKRNHDFSNLESVCCEISSDREPFRDPEYRKHWLMCLFDQMTVLKE